MVPDRRSRGLRASNLALAALLLCFAVAACGDSSAPSTSSASKSSSGESASGQLNALYRGSYTNPPSSSPKPTAGKDIWIISPYQGATLAAAASKAGTEAANSLGWKAKVFDAKGDPSQYLAGVRQAVAAGADGILLLYIDCQYVKPGLAEAKKAGIKVVAIQSFDCGEDKAGSRPMFDYVVRYQQGSFEVWIKSWGAAQATWVENATDGKAKVIEFKENDAAATLKSSEGFRSELKKCAGCEVVDTVEFTVGDLGDALQQKAQQAFLKNPAANSIVVPYDAVLTAGVLPALRSSRRAAQTKVMGGEGDPANLALIRDHGGQDAAVGAPSPWEAYAAFDGLNRLFAGQDPSTAKTGLGLQVIDHEHNLPASGPYQPIGADGKPIDFAKLYEQAWSASG